MFAHHEAFDYPRSMPAPRMEEPLHGAISDVLVHAGKTWDLHRALDPERARCERWKLEPSHGGIDQGSRPRPGLATGSSARGARATSRQPRTAPSDLQLRNRTLPIHRRKAAKRTSRANDRVSRADEEP
jgi:hypothetical protein